MVTMEASNSEKPEELQCGITVTGLANLPIGTMLDERALAELLHVSPRTIRRMVGRGELPAGVRLGVRKVWFSDKVLNYLNSRAESLAEKSLHQAKRMEDFF